LKLSSYLRDLGGGKETGTLVTNHFTVLCWLFTNNILTKSRLFIHLKIPFYDY